MPRRAKSVGVNLVGMFRASERTLGWGEAHALTPCPTQAQDIVAKLAV